MPIAKLELELINASEAYNCTYLSNLLIMLILPWTRNWSGCSSLGRTFGRTHPVRFRLQVRSISGHTHLLYCRAKLFDESFYPALPTRPRGRVHRISPRCGRTRGIGNNSRGRTILSLTFDLVQPMVTLSILDKSHLDILTVATCSISCVSRNHVSDRLEHFFLKHRRIYVPDFALRQ